VGRAVATKVRAVRCVLLVGLLAATWPWMMALHQPGWWSTAYSYWARTLPLLLLIAILDFPWKEDVAFMACVFLASAACRLWLAWQWPPPPYPGLEEAQCGLIAWNLLRTGTTTPQFLWTNMLATIGLILGHTYTTLRAPFFLASALAPVVLFAAMRRLLARPAALAASLLCATLPFAALGGRFADEYLAPLLLAALAVWGVATAVSTQRLLGTLVFALAGGLLFYEHDAYKPYVAVAGLLAGALIVRRRLRIDHAAVLLAAWWVMCAPALLPFSGQGEAGWLWEGMSRHVHERTAGYALTAVQNAQTILHMLFVGGKPSPWFLTQQPIFGTVGAICTALALSVACVSRRMHLLQWSALLFGVLFAGACIIPMNVVEHRLMVFILPATLLTAALFDVLWTTTGGKGVVVGMVVVGIAINVWDLDNSLHDVQRFLVFETPGDLVVAAVVETPPRTHIVLWDELGDWNLFVTPSDAMWLLQDKDGERVRSLEQAIDAGRRCGPGSAVRWIVHNHPEDAERLATAVGASVMRRPSISLHTTLDIIDKAGG